MKPLNKNVMKLTKLIALVVLLMISLQAFCQTKLIAHRSHSGKIGTFRITNSADNFGLPSEKIDSIIKISNTKILEISNRGNRGTFKIKDHPYFKFYFKNPQGSIDSLKKVYPKIKFVDFEKDFSKKKPISQSK
jgi:hypothetical protein